MACLVAAASSGAAAAQSRLNLSLSPGAVEAQALQEQRDALGMPVIDYVAPDGRLAPRRGVIAGVDLNPQMSFGLGIFEGAPKRRMGAVDPAKPERRSKRAAIGFSLKF